MSKKITRKKKLAKDGWSTSASRAYIKAIDVNMHLQVRHFVPDECVSVFLEDGSNYTYRSAFYTKHGEYYVIFAEHNKPYVEHEDEVLMIYAFTITHDKPETLTDLAKRLGLNLLGD